MNNLKDAREKRFQRARERAAKRQPRRRKGWREWSEARAKKAAAPKMPKERQATVNSDEECIDVVERIAEICQRASLPNASRYLAACGIYLRSKQLAVDPGSRSRPTQEKGTETHDGRD